MSGIVGMVLFDGSAVDQEDLERMAERIRHRGPDGSAVWIDAPVGLGHVMLHTTPESLFEGLPYLNRSEDLVITLDGRIDNRDELSAALCRREERLEEIGDAELILRSYERWGEGCIDKLLGDFAFAIWDRREGALFCGRDHMGIRPFYYHLTDRGFIFASEIKAILSLPGVLRELDEVTLSNFLVPIFDDWERTFYAGIRRLPAAHFLTLKDGNFRMKRYWSLDPDRKIRLSSDEEYAAEFRRIFLEAVRCRLRSAFPIGVTLSGGLDSSSVACSARKILCEEGYGLLHTFSAVFDEVPECDERDFMSAVIDQGGFEPHRIRADLKSPLDEFCEFLKYEDEPFWILNYYINWNLFKAAKQEGVRVIMDGVEGDVVVSHGLTFLVELVLSGRPIELWRTLRDLSRNFDTRARRIFWNKCVIPLTPAPVTKAYRWIRGIDHYREQCSIINPRFAERVGLKERFNSDQNDSNKLKNLRKDHYEALTSADYQHLLEVIDRQASALSLECRHPFFDKRLVEFCLALPPEQKLRRGWTRWILRYSMSGILPENIQWRGGKGNIGLNFNRGLLTSDRKMLETVIFEDMRAIEDYVDISLLQQIYRRFELEKSGEDAITLWKTVTAYLWLSRSGFANGGVGRDDA